MGQIRNYDLLEEFKGDETFIVETDEGTKSLSVNAINTQITKQVSIPVQDIQVDNASIVSAEGTAEIPYASNFNREFKAGIVKTNPYRYYISTDENGFIHGGTIPYSVLESEEISRDAFISKGTLMDYINAFIASKLDVQKKQDRLENEVNIASINGHDLTQGGQISTKEKWVLLNSINDMTKQEIVNGCPFITLYRGDIPYSKFVVNVQFPKESITANATFYVKIGATKDAAINDTINLAGCALNKGCVRYNAEVRKQGNENWKVEYSTQTAVYYGAQTGNLVNDQGNLAAMEGAKTIVVAMPYQTNITAFPEGTVMNLWGITDE